MCQTAIPRNTLSPSLQEEKSHPLPNNIMFHAVTIIKKMLKSSQSFLVVLARQNAQQSHCFTVLGGVQPPNTASGS